MTLGAASSTDISTLLGFTRYLAGTTNNVSIFSDAQITSLLNQAQKNLQVLILRSIKFGFEENATAGTGNGAINLVAGTNAYSFPTGMLTVERVEINYTGGTNEYVAVNRYYKEKIGQGINNTNEYAPIMASTTSPIYWTFGGKFYIDPVPTQAVTSGLKIWYTTTVSNLASSSAEPVFVEFAHEILCLEAAYYYKLTKDMKDDAQALLQRKTVLEANAIDFYCNRDQTQQTRMTRKIYSFR